MDRSDLPRRAETPEEADRVSAEFTVVNALEPGVYWKTKHETEINQNSRGFRGHTRTLKLPPNLTLLLVDIERFDGIDHTVVLQQHPAHGDGTYRVLVDEFLRDFEPEPDGEAIRQREMDEIHAEVAGLQDELQRGQVDSTVMAPALEEGLAKWRTEVEEKVASDNGGTSEGSSQGSASTPMLAGGQFRTDIGYVLEQRLTDADTQSMKLIAEREAKIAQLKADWLQKRTDGIADAFRRLQPFFAEKSAVALAKTRAVRQQAESIMRGVASLDLYTGKGVTVHTICEGEGAVASEPLTLMQRKLFMDEELAVWAPVGENFDFQSHDAFLEHLASSPSLRDQLLPTPRCVVSMAVRRKAIDYGDMASNLAYNQMNRQVFLLVRNGDNVHQVFSSAPSHELAPRLFPTHDEYDQLFAGIDGSHITFQDIEFTQRASAAEDLMLHYRRFLILLCGLDHRLQLFGGFYNPDEALSFLTLPFQQRYLSFVADDEDDRLLAENRPSVEDWLQEKNRAVQSGSRVLCDFGRLLQEKNAPACFSRTYYGGRSHVDTIATPEKADDTLVVYRDKGALCVPVWVERQSFADIKQTHFTARVEIDHPSVPTAWPGYLCLDDVEAEELEWYIHNRQSRVRHIKYIRLFKACLESLRKEAKREAPTREYLANALNEAGLTSTEEAGEIVKEACKRWRVAHRGEALPPLGDHEGIQELLDQVHSLSHHRSGTLLRQAEALISDKGWTPLKVSIDGKNRLVVYHTAELEPGQDVLMPWGWVRRTILKPLKTKVAEASSRMVWLSVAGEPSETQLKAWPELAQWQHEHNAPCTLQRQQKAIQMVDQACEEAAATFMAEGAGIPEPAFERYLHQMLQVMRGGRRGYVEFPDIQFPIAAYAPMNLARPKGPYHVVVMASAELVLHHFADPDQRERVKQVFLSPFMHPEAHERRFEQALQVHYGVVRMESGAGGVTITSDSRPGPSQLLRPAFRDDNGKSLPLSDFLAQWQLMMDDPSSSMRQHLDRAYIHPLAREG